MGLKSIISIICILFVFNATYSQKIALIDRDFKKPILFTDSVTISQVSSNYFPVRVSDLDSLIGNLKYVSNQIKTLQRSKLKSYKLRSGQTTIQVIAVPHAYGDSYDILLASSISNVIAEYLLADNRNKNKKAIKNVNYFIEYIKKDKEIFIRDLGEYEPVMLDATIYIPSKN